jgi:hypothetical protein
MRNKGGEKEQGGERRDRREEGEKSTFAFSKMPALVPFHWITVLPASRINTSPELSDL